MITKDKSKIFDRYDGDIDSWARSESKKDKLNMTDSDWHIIDSLIQDLCLVRQKLSSPGFNNALDNKLKESCEDEPTIAQLKRIADKQ